MAVGGAGRTDLTALPRGGPGLDHRAGPNLERNGTHRRPRGPAPRRRGGRLPGALLHLRDRGWRVVSVIASLGFPEQRDRRPGRSRRGVDAGAASCPCSSTRRSTSRWATIWRSPPSGWRPRCRGSWPSTTQASSCHRRPTMCTTGTRWWTRRAAVHGHPAVGPALVDVGGVG